MSGLSETQERVLTVRQMIRDGLSNNEIRAALPQYDLHTEMLRSNRRKLRIPNPKKLIDPDYRHIGIEERFLAAKKARAKALGMDKDAFEVWMQGKTWTLEQGFVVR